MTKRSGRIGVGVALALAAARPAAAQTAPATPAAAPPVIRDTNRLPGPRQPIFFRHDVHAGQDRIPCLYCHSTVTISSEPGIPALQTCFGCHLIIGGSTPAHQVEIKKVLAAWATKQPPQWIRVHTLPGFVRFPHQRHIKALALGPQSCVLCHGDVAQMPQVYQVKTLKMGWCVSCHVQHGASRDCTVCHY